MHVLATRFLHFTGVFLWIGGLTAVAFAATSISTQDGYAGLRKAALRVATPGMLLAWLGGLGMLLPLFSDYYATQGWMHGKLTLVFIASGLSGVLTGKLRKAATGSGELTPGTARVFGIALIVIAVLVVFLATFKPGGDAAG